MTDFNAQPHLLCSYIFQCLYLSTCVNAFPAVLSMLTHTLQQNIQHQMYAVFELKTCDLTTLSNRYVLTVVEEEVTFNQMMYALKGRTFKPVTLKISDWWKFHL